VDPFTIAVVIALAAYITAPVDPHTLRATRGAAGVARAAGSGARGHVRAERARTAPSRARARQARQKRWRESGVPGRAGLLAESGARKAGRGVVASARTAHAAVKAAPSGYKPAADRAIQRRDEAREKRRARRAAAVTPTITEPTVKEPAPVDTPAIPATELATVTDLQTETTAVQAKVADIQYELSEVRKWATDLAERYSAAEFGTIDLTKAVYGVQEAVPTAVQVDGLLEALDALQKAFRSAEAVREVVDSAGATGKTEAFASA
jgi:hypothetical protein